MQDILGGRQLKAKVACFVGTQADPIHGRTPWGELAHQLSSYELIKENDQRRVCPGKQLLSQVLNKSQSTLILIDEILEYVVKAAGVTVEEGTLKGQVLAFLQELTETVAASENHVLVIALPSSALERYDEAADEALTQLQKISGRVEAIHTPVEGEESYEVIRKRLFEDLGDMKTHKLVADEYFNLYQKLGEDIPPEAREIAYRDKITRAYPFHPELIDVLFERWGTIPTFQRTRGVLRLLAEVVADLYKREHTASLIQSAHVNPANSSIRREFIKHIGNEYESVVVSDIDGDGAKSARIDREMGTEYLQHKVATGLATSVFLYSFSGGERKGISLPRLRLALLRNGIPPAIVGDAIRRLEEDLWFIHFDKSLYYFWNQPNLNRVIVDKEEATRDPEVEREIQDRIKGLAGEELTIFLYPRSSSDIPDDRRLKLAIVSPFYGSKDLATGKFLQELLNKHGSGFRVYKNTIVFVVADSSEYEGLKKGVRRLMALREIRADKDFIKALSEENKRTLEQKLRDTESDIPVRILSTYRHLVKGSKEGLEFLDMGIPTVGEKPNLSKRVKEYLKLQDKLLEKVSAKYVVEKALAKEEDKKEFKEVYEIFLKSLDLPMIENEGVIRRAIVDGIKNKSLGISENETVYYGEPISEEVISPQGLIIKGQVAEGLKAGITQVEVIEEVKEVRLPPGKVNKICIKARIPWDKLSSLVSGVFRPLQQEGADISLQIEISARSDTGISKDTIDLKVKETLNQIGAEDIKVE
ncbi:ATP-binding protein [Dehalococcoidia bacterium]|nr:ATP-binding protein [Dehalococcoidia bacterium]